MSLITKELRLCVTSPKTVIIRIIGEMPLLSETSCYAELILDGVITLWRYDAETGADPACPMVGIDEYVMIPAFYPGPHLRMELNIPGNASVKNGVLDFIVVSPTFQLSPVVNGFDSRCLVSPEPPLLSFPGFDIDNPGDRYVGAKLIERLYVDFEAAKAILAVMGPVGMVIHGVPALGPVQTGIIGAATEGVAIIGKVGTQNPEQLVTQGGQLLGGPILFGGVETIRIWNEVSQHIENMFYTCGGAGLTRVILIGHSLGGASCMVAAARLVQLFPDIKFEILTFGAPRPMSRRDTVLLNNNCRVVRVENFRDPVPYFPPRANELNDLTLGLVPKIFLSNMAKFSQPWGGIIFFDSGRSIVGDANEPDIAALSNTVLFWIAVEPGPTFANHFMDHYVFVMGRALDPI